MLQQPPQLRFLLAEWLEGQLVGFVFPLLLNFPNQGPKYRLAGDFVGSSARPA